MKLPAIDTLWDDTNPAESEKRLRDMLRDVQAVLVHPAWYILELQTQIARAESLQRKFEDAHRTLDRIADDVQAHPRAGIRYLLERGRVYNASGRKGDAIPYLIQAWEKAQAEKEDFYAVDAAHMLSIAHPPHQQREWKQKAIAYAVQSQDERARRWLDSLDRE